LLVALAHLVALSETDTAEVRGVSRYLQSCKRVLPLNDTRESLDKCLKRNGNPMISVNAPTRTASSSC
jgi:hypothetical protein